MTWIREFERPDGSIVQLECPELLMYTRTEGGTQERRSLDSVYDAQDAHIDEVLALFEDGAIEVLPWLSFCDDANHVRQIRVPHAAYLETQDIDGVVTRYNFGQHHEALLRYNRVVLRWRHEGFHHTIPTWEDVAPRLESPWVERSGEKRHWYALDEDPEYEFGPEMHLRNGQLRWFNFQMQTKGNGFCVGYKEGYLHSLETYHQGENRGIYCLFEPNAQLSFLRVYGSSRMTRYIGFDEGALDLYSYDGYNAFKQRVGLWVERYHQHDLLLTYKDGEIVRREKVVEDARAAHRALVRNITPPTIAQTSMKRQDGAMAHTIYYEDGGPIFKTYITKDGALIDHQDVFDRDGARLQRWAFDPPQPDQDARAMLTFISLAAKPKSSRVLEIPVDGTLRYWIGKRLYKKEHESYQAACDAMFKRIHQWVHKDRLVLEGPWLTWCNPDGQPAVQLQLPVGRALHSRSYEDGQWEASVDLHDTSLLAMLAFNQRLKQLYELKYTLLIPEQHPYQSAWPVPCAELVYTSFDGDDRLVSRRSFVPIDSVDTEVAFGPQREVFADGFIVDSFNVQDKYLGWQLHYAEGQLQRAQSLFGTQRHTHGHLYTWNEKGYVDVTRLLHNDNGIETLYTQFEDNPGVSQHIDTIDDVYWGFSMYFAEYPQTLYSQGYFTQGNERHLRWMYYREDGTVERQVDFDRDTITMDIGFDAKGKITHERVGGRDVVRKALLCGAIETNVPVDDEMLYVVHGENCKVWFDPYTERLTNAAIEDEYYVYPPEMFGPTKPKIGERWSDVFGQMRSALQGEHTRDGWVAFCAAFELLYRIDSSRWHDEVLSYAQDAAKSWPSTLRMAPLLWINKLIVDALPVEALNVVSSLSFTAALCVHYIQARTPLLLLWLDELPDDCVALEGLHLSYRHDVIKAIQAEMEREQDKRFHTDFAEHQTYTYEEQIFEEILKSQLCRRLRVVDCSHDAPPWDYYLGWQGPTDGRTASLDRLLSELQEPDALEILDLQGNDLDQYPSNNVKLPNVVALNLSQTNPLNSDNLKHVQRTTPNLKHLSMIPHCIGWLLGQTEVEDEDVWQNIQSYWSIYELDGLTFSAPALRKLLKALPLESLYLADYYESVTAVQTMLNAFKSLSVKYNSPHNVPYEALPSDWPFEV